MFRTRIREAAAEGIAFAGRVALTQFGCGTGCSIVIAIDLATGRIYNFPRGGEDDQMLTLHYRPWSRLIAAWWMTDTDGPCMRQDFVWYPKDGFVAQDSPVVVAKPCPATPQEQ